MAPSATSATRRQALPLGPHPIDGDRLRLAVWAPHAETVEIETRIAGAIARYAAEAGEPGSWHVELPLSDGASSLEYRWRLDGGPPLLDPYAPHVVGGEVWGADVERAGAQKERWSAWRRSGFDWQGVEAPAIDPTRRIVYELSVRGYTRHRTSGVEAPGTFRGLLEKIPYWLELGITTLQLLPVAEFDELEIERRHPESGEPLRNLWGYSPLSFLAPKAGFGSRAEPGAAATEFQEFVRECHRVGLEVVIDVVFNHTAEKDLRGDDPVYSWVGLDRSGYYLWHPDGSPRDVTGCGNTFAAGRTPGSELILAALRHWRREYRVDGFRFDLAAALTRGADGEPESDPELLRQIREDPTLDGAFLIAEAWDATGLYRLGEFPRWGPWAEWNGRFRDEMRCFVRGDAGQARNVALRLLGSPDLYAHGEAGAMHSLNYVASHDGFTLEDCVSYSKKHNLANGEGNRDGDSWIPSWNAGTEGPTEDSRIREQRRRQVEMLLTLLFLARGTPMLLAGDEFGRTQGGNNNSYCQDNEVGWVDWSRLLGALDRQDLVRRLIALRQRQPELRRTELPDGDTVFGPSEVVWHGPGPFTPDWSESSRFLAVQWLGAASESPDLYAAFNPTAEAVVVELPEPSPRLGGATWWRSLTAGTPAEPTVRLAAWGTLILVAELAPIQGQVSKL